MLVEHLPSKQCVVGSNLTRAALRKKVVRVSCLALFYIYRSKSFHVIKMKMQDGFLINPSMCTNNNYSYFDTLYSNIY